MPGYSIAQPCRSGFARHSDSGVGHSPAYYEVAHVTGETELRLMLPEWKSWHESTSSPVQEHDLEWLLHANAHRSDRFGAYLIRQRNRLVGFVPFLRQQWPLACHIGEIRTLALPLTRLHLLGGSIRAPDDPRLYDSLFTEIAQSLSGIDAVFIEGLRIDSALSQYVETSSLIRRRFDLYMPGGPRKHHRIRIPPSFDEYLAKFTPKHRRNLFRQTRKLAKDFGKEVTAVRYDAPDQVDELVDRAADLSESTYQYNLLGLGLRDRDEAKRLLRFAARRGWLRSYLLMLGDRVCAFMMTQQYGGTFSLSDIGYDSSLAAYSPGTCLLLLVIEDLCGHRQPEFLDFRLGTAGYKETFGNETYLDRDVFLFRKGIYPKVARLTHSASLGLSCYAAGALDKLNLKGVLKRAIRTRSTSRANA